MSFSFVYRKLLQNTDSGTMTNYNTMVTYICNVTLYNGTLNYVMDIPHKYNVHNTMYTIH